MGGSGLTLIPLLLLALLVSSFFFPFGGSQTECSREPLAKQFFFRVCVCVKAESSRLCSCDSDLKKGIHTYGKRGRGRRKSKAAMSQQDGCTRRDRSYSIFKRTYVCTYSHTFVISRKGREGGGRHKKRGLFMNILLSDRGEGRSRRREAGKKHTQTCTQYSNLKKKKKWLVTVGRRPPTWPSAHVGRPGRSGGLSGTTG